MKDNSIEEKVKDQSNLQLFLLGIYTIDRTFYLQPNSRDWLFKIYQILDRITNSLSFIIYNQIVKKNYIFWNNLVCTFQQKSKKKNSPIIIFTKINDLIFKSLQQMELDIPSKICRRSYNIIFYSKKLS